jgi:hypothetical protein
MHENRETSKAPASLAGRSAKAQSHNADMHVMEESDCRVVPVKQPNKEGKPSAEVVEGRRQPEENDAQSSTQPTQRGERVSQGLSGVRRVARERKQEQFTALLHHVTVRLLRESFDALKKNAAPGVDGVTWRDYETGLEDRLIDLHSRVHRGTYRAQPSRRVYIPKPDGRQRSLGIAAGNLAVLGRFRERLCRYWRHVLRRRSQRRKPDWEQLGPIFDRWIPRPRTLHPYPDKRFDARIQGRSRMR